jgi:hypothetical protein
MTHRNEFQTLDCSACCCCLSRYDIHIIDNYNISLTLYNSHVTAAQSIAGIIDCLHFCRPSLGEVRGCKRVLVTTCKTAAVYDSEQKSCISWWCMSCGMLTL